VRFQKNSNILVNI